jgi:hypothetical protein
MEQITAKSYTLKTETGNWLGQIVLTSDGMFSAVTDYGNMSFAWRNYGDKDFRQFLVGLNVNYFGSKMYQGMAYMIYGKKYDKACLRFAEMILPPLQAILKEELESECQVDANYSNYIHATQEI